MSKQRILTETDMARLLRIDVGDVLGAFERGELPGFALQPGLVRCTEPAFYEWADRRSREGAPEPREAVELAEEQYADPATRHDHFADLSQQLLPALEGETFATPDRRRSRPFRLDAVDLERPGILVSPLESRSSSPVWIRADAVNRCLTFLLDHVPPGEPTPIQASQNNPGPLARFTRSGNGGVRCLHYLLPILQRCELVAIDGDTRPNTVSLVADATARKARRHG